MDRKSSHVSGVHRYVRQLKTLMLSIMLISVTAADDKRLPTVQAEIKRLNSLFNSFPAYPIIIFDKSETSSLLNGKDQEEQKSLLKNYIQERLSISPSDNELIHILDYLGPLSKHALSQPFYRNSIHEGIHFCAVFPAIEPKSAITATKRILGVSQETDQLYQDYPFNQVAQKISAKELNLLSLYHELGHCLDPKYTRMNGMVYGHRIHQAEAFAESIALLLLHQQQDMTQVLPIRKELRRAYSRHMGPWLASQHVISTEPRREGGAIYYLVPIITGVEHYLHEHGAIAAKAPASELIKASLEIVEQYALDSRTYAALVSLFVDGDKQALSTYQDLATRHPDLFGQTYQHFNKIYQELYLKPQPNQVADCPVNKKSNSC